MILAPPRNLQSVGALESGKTVLLIEPSASAGGNPAVTLDWELRARPDSGGRSFALGLPGDETTELTLELPAGWLPLGPEGFREGPLPSSQTGFQSWRFHGRPELINLRLLDGRKPLPPGEESLIWVSGPTRIMLGSTESRDAQSANWKTDWTVQPDRRGLMRFTVELGPGLEFIAVSGPEVKEYQAEHEGEVTRVRVTLAGISRLPTPLHFEAHARVPLEGLWSVPAMRPLDAIWTGGTTTVVVDPLRVIQDCRERAGRRVPAQGGEPEDANVLVFEARSADPVADLVFHQTQAQPACQVRGRLLVGLAAPELECQLIGVGGRGPTRELSIELPPTWVPDRVRWSGADESLAWHPTIQADGSTRLHVLLPGGEGAPEGRALEIAASSTAAGGRGPLVLPRVRPSGLAILDETWVAIGGQDDDPHSHLGTRPRLDRSFSSGRSHRLQVCRESGRSRRPGLALEWRERGSPRGPRTGRARAQGRDPVPRESRTGREAPRRRRPDPDQAGQQSTGCSAGLGQPAGRRAPGLVFSRRPRKERAHQTPPGRSIAVSPRVSRDRPGLESFAQLARAGRKSGSLQGSASLEPARFHSLDIASPAVLTAEHGPARGPVPDAFRCPDSGATPARDHDGRAPRGLLAAGAQARPGWTGRL